MLATKVKMRDSEKKANRSTYDISSKQRVARKFHVVVVSNRGKKMYRSVMHVRSCFFAN